ncbi:hypothetical protein EZS27_006630 [termite gut metagenome]|uniref:Uncharacterized protein n=1 Tax=termite gut metagenome TaxID=433724 RepID=A0A5J4SI61_9ZZZZ
MLTFSIFNSIMALKVEKGKLKVRGGYFVRPNTFLLPYNALGVKTTHYFNQALFISKAGCSVLCPSFVVISRNSIFRMSKGISVFGVK